MQEDHATRTVELLNAVLAGIDVGATVQEPSGRLIYANATAAEILGFATPAELVAASGPEVMERFEAFSPDGTPCRRATTPGGNSRGLGLGLYITQQIVTAHGGTIEVDSHADRGTTVSVILPVRIEQPTS